MISTAEELLGFAKAASMKRLSQDVQVAETTIYLGLGLPDPSRATNEDLDRLRPIYTKIIQDIKAKKDNSEFLEMIVSDKARHAPVILAFLTWLFSVRNFRLGKKAGIRQRFELSGITHEINTAPELLRFFRSVIAEPNSSHRLTMAVSLGFFSGLYPVLVDLAVSKLQRLVTQTVYRGSDVMDGFKDFRNDLARFCVVNRDNISSHSIQMIVCAQKRILPCHFPKAEILQILRSASNEPALDWSWTHSAMQVKLNPLI